jgi:hypothetical protein
MVDSVQILDSGFRVLDANGNPINNAKIKFREVGPGATRTVYSDKDLATPLGHTVRTRSDGYPVVSFGSNTTVLIYTGNTPYHVEITDENDVAIFPAKDNVRGALDTSAFVPAGGTSILNEPVLSKTGSETIIAADKGKLWACNANGGFFTVTLFSAITAGDGFTFGVRNDGTANPVGISAGQNIATPWGNITAFSLRPGETVWLSSNGSTWKLSKYYPSLNGTVGIIEIAGRLSTPPVSPVAGARYIVGAAPTDAWVTFAQHDIAEATGQGTWNRIRPPTDCGWLAYVRDEDIYYSFQGSAWVSSFANAADMEAGTNLTRAVTPGLLHRHPGVPKAWALVTYSGGTPLIAAGYGFSSVSDQSIGVTRVNFTTAMSGANYCPNATTQQASGSVQTIYITDKTASYVEVVTIVPTSSGNVTANPLDQNFSVAVLGDQ